MSNRGKKWRVFPVFVMTCFAAAATAAAQDSPPPDGSLEIGNIGGWVLTQDHVTMIASLPEAGQLIFIDTVSEQKTKTVEVDFAPNRLALQGDTLFVSASGSSLIYALNATTGEQLNRFKLTGEPIEDLVCHERGGPLFASNLNEEIMVIDPKQGNVTATKAHGKFLAVDPINGRFLLAGTNRPSEDFVEVQRGANATRVRLVTVATRASVLKYEVQRNGLKLVAGNTNTAIGAGGSLAVSADGKKYAMVAGGGWRSLTDQRFRYVIAVFETDDMETMVGQIELGAYPNTMAFHTVLDLGVALRSGGIAELHLFSTRSLTDRGTLTNPLKARGAMNDLHRVMFVGKGTKLAYHYGKSLAFIPLELSDDDRGLLDKELSADRVRVALAEPADSAPDEPKEGFRTWRDTTGKFTIVAKLIAVGDGVVKLEKEDGKQISVPFERMNGTDLRYAKRQAGVE